MSQSKRFSEDSLPSYFDPESLSAQDGEFFPKIEFLLIALIVKKLGSTGLPPAVCKHLHLSHGVRRGLALEGSLTGRVRALTHSSIPSAIYAKSRRRRSFGFRTVDKVITLLLVVTSHVMRHIFCAAVSVFLSRRL
ncbi:hypothetical protein DY000_02022940 [Brassica cretica]|uniref:Uncharacterized protein n=1 Tax=Brassica cretica TaxID=69181 RepID=A0ABQ7EKV3_BRACR|nr:hypothetical protein DY000_02022940 [Brassica cretica]